MAILIVDDSSFSLKVMQEYLRSEGYKDILTAKSAAEAFQILETYPPDNCNISLILMDLVMQDMNGIDACRKIKENTRTEDIPVIIVTACLEKEELKRAFSAGAVDYITKPFNRIELLARVHSALKLKHETDCRKERESALLEITSQLETINETLRKLTFRDGLTGVANRRYFDETFTSEFGRAKRQSSALSIIMLDVDYFKLYNDTYGHLQGDDCLKLISLAIQGSLKRPGDFVARYGGEEFIIVLPETDLKNAVLLAEKLRSSIEDLRIPHTSSLCHDVVTVSIGISCLEPKSDLSMEELLYYADKALYHSKENGRNRASLYTKVNESCSSDNNQKSLDYVQ